MPYVDFVPGQEVVAGAAGILGSSLVFPSSAATLSVLHRLPLEVGLEVDLEGDQEEAAVLVFEFGPMDVEAEVVVDSYVSGRRAGDPGHIAVERPL
jgi:hypothetical protein